MDSRQKKAIIKLQSLSPHSIEHYETATKFFRVRSHSIRSCGFFFLFCSLFGIMEIFAPWETWFGHLRGFFIALLFGFLGWGAFRMGRTQIVLIRASHTASQKNRENTLRFFCKHIYCTQPIGIFILRQLGDDAQAALNPIVKRKLKKKFKIDEEYNQQVESKEKPLQEMVNRELQNLFQNSK
jgi:hypothetical protein